MCAGLVDVEADSAGPLHPAEDLASKEVDVRDRIYDMVRPLNWMEEAPEPPGSILRVFN